MATVGQTLLIPEVGWKRYDDRDSNINYVGNWTSHTITGYYNNTVTDSTTLDSYYEFQFRGTKLRIIDAKANNRSTNVVVSIDGVEESYSSYSSSTVRGVLVYEKIGLSNGVHTVRVTNKDTGILGIDAIDIDDDGYFGVIDKILILNDNKTYSLERINTWHETKMTSNTTPAPFIASASSMWTAVSPLPPYKAFNGTNIDSYDCWATADGQVKGWIQIDFGEKKRVNMLSLTSRNASDPSIHAVSGFPKDIIIHGSNDGINFEQIKSFDSLSVTTYNEIITLKLPTSYYRIYRLEILSNNGNTRFTAIGEISYGLKEDKVINIPSYSEQNFINYGMYSPIKFDGVFANKNYVLQNGISENENGYWTTKLDRKPLSIKFE